MGDFLNFPPQLLAREFFNGLWTVLTFAIAAMAGIRIVYEWVHWHRYLTFREFRRRPVVRVGIAMLIYFAAEHVQRGWVYVLLRLFLVKSEARDWWDNLWPMPLGASAVAVVGGLCIIRVLAPEGWGRTASLATLAAGVIFLGVTLPIGFHYAVWVAIVSLF